MWGSLYDSYTNVSRREWPKFSMESKNNKFRFSISHWHLQHSVCESSRTKPVCSPNSKNRLNHGGQEVQTVAIRSPSGTPSGIRLKQSSNLRSVWIWSALIVKSFPRRWTNLVGIATPALSQVSQLREVSGLRMGMPGRWTFVAPTGFVQFATTKFSVSNINAIGTGTSNRNSLSIGSGLRCHWSSLKFSLSRFEPDLTAPRR